MQAELPKPELQPDGDAVSADVTPNGGRQALVSLRAYGLRPLVLLFILNAVDEFDRAVLAVALDDIREHFGVSDATVGLLPLAVIFVTGILSLPAGNWADRWVRVNILAIGALVWGAAGLLAAASRTFWQLFITRAILGVGQGTIAPTHASLLADYYPMKVRGRALNYHRSANAFGQVIGAVIGSAIIAAVGWRWGFAAAAVPGLLFGAYALTLREPKRGEADLNDAMEQNPLLREFLREPADKKGFWASQGDIWRNLTLRYCIFANAAIGFTLFGVAFWFPTFFEREYGASTQTAGLLFGALALSAFLGTWFGGPFADRELPKGFSHLGRLCTYACALLVVAWVIAFSIPIPWISFPILVISGFFASYGTAGAPSIVAAVSPPRIRGQAFATFGLALVVLGAAAAPVVVGGLSELFQRYADLSEGTALRMAMLLAVATVMSLGTWVIWLASRHATDDAQRTMTEFIRERTGHSM
jgi:MFS family permease